MPTHLLTVVISTHNRIERLKSNLENMLGGTDDRVCFLIGDNCSDDGTDIYLNGLKETNVKAKINKANMGFENCWLLSFYVDTPFFVFVNDRDYISNDCISRMCDFLENNPDFDLISFEKGNWKQGINRGAEFVDVYFGSRHPGTLVYKTSFCRSNLSKEVIEEYLRNNQQSMFNIYLVKQLLGNLTQGYSYKEYMVIQPVDRERIKQERNDYYGCSYITCEYRKLELEDWLSTYEETATREEKAILLGVIKNALYTLSYEYYCSVQIEGFIERNNCYGEKKGKWLRNITEYICFALRKKIVGQLGIKGNIVRLYIASIIVCLKYIIIGWGIEVIGGLSIRQKRSA